MTNHNQLPTSTPELSVEERSVLSIAKLNEWRSRQYSILNGLREADNFSNPDYLEAFDSFVGESLDDFLQEQGLDANSPNYGDIRALFYDARIGTDNGNGISEDAWGNSPASRGIDPNDHKSQSDIFKERIEERLAVGVDASDGSEGSPERTAEEWEEHAADYEEYASILTDVDKNRDSWAKAASKRLGRAFSIKDKEREKLKNDYHNSVQELGKLELQAVLEDDSVSADEKNIAVITFLFDEQTRLREQTLENLKSTKVSRFVEWMNKGSVATRVAKSIGIGALAGVTGGVLAGAAGAGVIAAGAVAGSRFVKGYASKDRHRGSKMPDKLDGVDLRNSHDTKLVLEHLSESNDIDILGSASDKVNSFFEDDIKDEQNERRKALGIGALSIVAGAGIGYGISNIGVLGDAKDAIHDKLGDWIGGNSNDGAPAPSQDIAPSGPAVEPSPPDTTDALNGRGDVFNGYMGTRALTPEAINLMNEQLNGYTVKPGDSIWSLSEDFLQSQGIEHPTVYEIDATKDVLLKELRAEGLADARGWLSVGDTLRIT